MISYRECIDRITPYVPGKGSEEVAKEYGLTEIVKLASNENPLGPSRQAVEALQRSAKDVFLYPDGASRALVDQLAEKLAVPRECLIIGNGSDEVIKLLAEAYLEPGDQVIYADPTFSEYAYATRLMGAEEVVVPLDANGVHDLEAMLRAVTPKTKLVFVCNPNNPTGTAVDHVSLERLLDALPSTTLLVCDEAYVEYADAPDFPDSIKWIREGRNVLTLRTFSKVYGLAGLRVGYGVAPASVMRNIWRVKEPFNVNRLAQIAALAALADTDHLQQSQKLNRTERTRLSLRLTELGFVVTPSQANFVWVDIRRAARPIFEALLRRGVIVRCGDAFGQPQHLRITVGTPTQNDEFLTELSSVIAHSDTEISKGAR